MHNLMIGFREGARTNSLNAILVLGLVCVALGIQPTPTVEARNAPSVFSKGLTKSFLDAPLYLPTAPVNLTVPSTVQIGQAFSFTATFDNTDADEVGYGPFIDIAFPVTGTDGAGAAVDDGIDFVSATLLGAPVTTVQNIFGPANTGGCAGGLGPVTHPYAVTLGTGVPQVVCGTPGDKLVTLLLPFGSFTPDQPPAVVTVNATMSNQADLNTTLNLRARGGYQYGATPTNDWCCGDATIVSQAGPSTGWPATPVSPRLITLTKAYNGPENETATGPNYPRTYTLTVDVATGQPVTNLTITDNLPGNLQFVSIASSTPASTCTLPGTTVPGGTLTCNFGTVTGGAGANDASLTFNFYIPLNDSGGNPVLNAVSGDDATSANTSTATGSWDPIDPRDPITPATAGGVCPEGCHTLTDKSIAIQKSVATGIDTGATGNSPGDTLSYTLTFQISDFFSFQNVVLTDVLSDGQRMTGPPTLAVNGNGYSLGSSGMNAANYTIDNSQIGNTGPNPPADGTNGTQTILFRVSDEIITRGQNGSLVGGCIPPNGLNFATPDTLLNCDPLNGGYDNDATIVTVTFRAIIQGDFSDTYPSGDSSVDHGDLLTNNGTVAGDLLDITDNSTVTGQGEADTSSTSISIAFGSLQKGVYAVNGTVCDPCTTEISTTGVSAGDEVTFRLRYSQPSSDFEQTVLVDYLPLPIFKATTIGAFSNAVCGVPGGGTACLGPADTYHSLVDPNPVVTPVMSTNATNNMVSFTYAAYDSVNNTSSNIDLLFTVIVDDEPFADGLFLTNQANTTEGTTNAGNQVLNTILQIKIDEPLLIPTKSAVSTDSTASGVTFTPALAGPLVFDVPGGSDAAPDWTTNATPGWSAGEVINSTYLTANPINANLSGIDGGDLIKFAIVIENRGRGIDGAFDIAIKDARPAELVIPAGGLNLEVFLGDGTPIAFTDLGGGLFGNGIMLTDPGVPPSGACQAHDATSGQNVIIITYDLQLSGSGVTNPNIINTTTLLSYSSTKGGPNFIPSGVTDTARVTPATPALTKTLKTSSEAHTSDVSSPPRGAIGEIVRYRLRIYLPEGTFTNFQIDDNLPGGLVYLDDGTARVAFLSNGPGISSANVGTIPVLAIPGGCVVTGNEATAVPDPFPCVLDDSNVGSSNSITTDPDTYNNSTDPQFKLGTLVNADTDADREVIFVEFNALINNSAVGSNDASEDRDNTFQLNVNGAAYGAVSAAQRVRISEPSITNLNKTVNPTATDAGNVVTYTVTFSNVNTVNTTTAFDVNLTDVVPAKMTLNLGSLTTAYVPAACSALTGNTSAGNNINLTFAVMPANCAVTVTYQATLLGTVIPGEALTNTANLIYTSLPGSNGTIGNATGTNNTGAPGSDTGERNGSGGATPHDDYLDSDGAQVDVTQTQPVKSILGTSAAHTSETGDGSLGNPRPLAIGEEITYGILLTFGEGTTPADTVVDDLPSGLEIVTGTPIVITTAAASGGLLTADFSGTIGTQAINSVIGDGGRVTFDFTNVVVAGDNDLTNNSILLSFAARVTNIAANVAGTSISNSATNQVGAGAPVASNIVRALVVEPGMTYGKTIVSLPTPLDAGGVVQYRITYVNGTGVNVSTAMDVRITDPLPAQVAVNLPVTVTLAGGAAGLTDASTANNVDITVASVPAGGSVIVDYTATIQGSVTPGQIINNTSNSTWTSLTGTVTGERTGDDGPTGSPNNYAATSGQSFTSASPAITKQLTTTSAVHTSGVNVAIGEEVTYAILLTLPEGTTPADTVLDDLPAGLEVVAGTPEIITTAAASGGLLTADFNSTIGAQNISAVVGDGGSVNYTFTNLVVAADNVTTNNTVLLRFRARVTNTAVNISGATISNQASNQVGAGTPVTSNSVNVNVVEPRLNIAKSADDSSWIYGQTVTFTLNVSHDVGSLADAFDIAITDTVPAGLTYVAGSISAPANWTTNASAPNLTFTCSTANGCSLPLAGSTALSYQGSVDSPPNPNAIVGDATVTNTANMQWTSLPGDNNPGNPSGERDGSGGVNNYNDISNHTGGLVGYYALGNRVWFDTDNDSQIDFGTEVGVDNVIVDLYRATDLNTIIATDATSADGYYLFDYLDAGDYVVTVAASNFANGAVLDTYWSSGTTLSGAGIISESAAPDADATPTDSDDNGTLQGGGSLNGAVAALSVTLGPGATEPAGETDLQAVIGDGDQPDARANMTVDFGFYRMGVGNLVWLEDVTANGVYDAGETMVGNASVRLYASNGTTEILVGPDGALGTPDDAINGVVTDASGLYAFSGLPQGDYVLRVIGPAGTISTTDAFNTADTTNPTNNIDNNDNGIGSVSNSVSSGTLTMTPGLAQVNNTVNPLNGTTTNPTVDFGFTYPYSVGNRVWFDSDNDSQIDFGTEVGVNGVIVELYAADGTGNPTGSILATDSTTNGGYYLFDDLFPGNYVVVIPSSNFAGAGVLTGYWSSATTRAADGSISEVTAALAETHTDSDDNGTRQTAGVFANSVISSAVTLGPIGLTEPVNETDLETGLGQGNQPNGRANMTVDFGFYRVAVGNLVFGDLNKNGTYDGGDTLLSNVAVELLSANGSSIGITTTTDVNGLYQFTDLPQGDYIIRTTAPAGTASTIDSFNQTDNDIPNTNADNNDNGDGMANGAVSSAVVSLTPGLAQNFNTVDHAVGTTTNPTLDFGFSLAYALGNRVWFDTNNNSQIDLGTEVGVDGVVVDLYAASDLSTVLASDTTSGGGYYLFNNLDAGSYVVAVRAANFAGGAILDGYWSSGTTRAANGSLSENAAPGPDANASDTDDNGRLQTSGTLSGAVLAQVVTLGPGGVEPTGESDLEGGAGQGQPDSQANMTVDFGFYTIQLGNLIWNDNNIQDSGQFDATEAGIQFVDVQLWSSDGTQLISTDTTDAAGNYSFTGLPQGSYFVRIPASEFNPLGTLRDFVSSTGGAGTPYEPAPSPDANVTDSDDNGTITGGVLGLGGYAQSAVFALTPAAEESVNHSQGLTLETRVDFGVFVHAQADLSVTKTDGVPIYIPNDTLNYTITVTNQGPGDATNASVSDTRPVQITSWTWTCAVGTPAAYNCTDSVGNSATFNDLLDLPQGASVTYHVAATVSSAPIGDLTNSVTVSVPTGVTEINPGNNTANDIDQLASLQITKDDGLLIVGPGSTVTYQIVVTNNGAVDLTSVNVTEPLPSDLTYQSAIPAPSSVTGNVLAWSGLSLARGASVTLNIVATVTASPSGATINNVVNVTDTNTTVSATANDQDSVASSSDFAKAMVNSDALHTTDPAVTIGEILTYQLSLAVPPGSMNNALIVDTPQSGLAFVDCVSINLPAGVTSSTLANGACNTLDGSSVGSNPLIGNSGGKVTFDLGTLANTNAAPSTLTITYQMIVLDIKANQTGGSLQNTAVWSWSGGSLAASSAALNIVEPDLSIDKNASATQAPYGSLITFTLDIAHTAGSSAHAFDVVVTDVLPTGLAFVPGSLIFTGLAPTSNTYDPATFTLTFLWDEFQLGQSVRITFNATFVGPSPVLNSTNVYWSSLPIDPTPTGPVQLSPYNPNATERWYDPLDTAGLNNYGSQDSVTITLPLLPETGFAPGVETILPLQPGSFSYADLGDFWVEIPQLGVKLPIVGVPLNGEGWNLTWLGEQAGWLEGSAYPTHNGNSVLTAHVFDAEGQPGPFVNLIKLYWGHRIIIHLVGQKYVYEVREVRTVWPNDKKVFKHDDYSWLTLITCKDYNKNTNTYAQRIAVRAVLISVEDE